MRHPRRTIAALLSVMLLASASPAYGVSTKVVSSVSFSDANNGIMAGGVGQTSGFISRTTDGGQTWTAVARPAKVFSVSSLPGLSYAGTSALINVAESLDGGQSWDNVSFDSDGVTVDAVAAKPGGGAYAVGDDQTTSGYGTLANVWSLTGDTWTRVFEAPKRLDGDGFPIATDAKFADVGVASNGHVWVVGTERNTGVGDGSTPTFKDALVFKSTNGGSSWTTQTVQFPLKDNAAYALTCIDVVDANNAYIAGTTSYIYRTTNGGTTWTVPTPLPNTLGTVSGKPIDIRDIAVSPTGAMVIVGVGQPPSTTGYISYTPAAGSAWGAPKQVTPFPMNSVEFLDANNVIAVGEEEQVYRSTNGGASWTAVSSAPAAPDVAITAPTASTPLSNGTLDITGTADDAGVGVASVEVQVKRANNQYYDGSGWVSSAVWLPVTSANGFQTWSRSIPSATSDVIYTVTARATDGLGQAKTTSVSTVEQRSATAVALTVKSTTLSYGASKAVTGTLKSGSTGLSGRTVLLEASVAGSPYTQVAQTSTSGGAFSFTVKPLEKTYYRVRFAGDTSYAPSGPTGGVWFEPKARLTYRPWATYGTSTKAVSTFYKTRTYTWRSEIFPKHTGKLYGTYFQIYKRNSSGTYKAYKTLTATGYDTGTAKSSFARANYKISSAGRYRVRTYHNDGGHAATYSTWTYITVK